MRTCTVTRDLRIVVRDDAGDFDDSHPMPPLALFEGHEGGRTALARKALRVIDRLPWLPAALARVPFRVAHEALLENFAAIDPDAIDASSVRWGRVMLKELDRGRPSSDGEQVGVAALVSIVLPTFNGITYLHESIASCLAQTHRNIELIVVDDGSSADIRSVVEKFADPRLRYLRHEVNKGIAEGLNTGFRASTGSLLTWTSDDNLFGPTAIETMVKFFRKNPDVDFVYASSYEIDELGEVTDTKIIQPKPPSWLPVANLVGACFMYKRRVFERVGDYDANVFLAEDYDYWLRVARQFKMHRLLKPLYRYRWHDASLTGRFSPEEVAKKVELIRRKNDPAATQ